MTEQEFRQQVLTLKGAMYGAGVRAGLSPDEAADAVQETLIGLWRSRQKIPSEPQTRQRYCFIAFRNVLVDTVKRRRHDADITESAGVKAPPEYDTEYVSTRRRLEQLIEMLPPAQAAVLRLSSFGDLDNRQIAKAIGETEVNVRQLLSRARRRLRDLFDNNFDK